MSSTEQWEGRTDEEQRRERVKIQKEERDSKNHTVKRRERREGIRPDTPSLIRVCCDKPL